MSVGELGLQRVGGQLSSGQDPVEGLGLRDQGSPELLHLRRVRAKVGRVRDGDEQHLVDGIPGRPLTLFGALFLLARRVRFVSHDQDRDGHQARGAPRIDKASNAERVTRGSLSGPLRSAELEKMHRAVEGGVVSARPRGGRLVMLLPSRAELHLDVAPQPGLAPRVVGRGVREPQVQVGRLSLVTRPVHQPAPRPHQTLVREIDDRVRVQGSRRWRRQERSSRPAKDFDDADDGSFGSPTNRGKLFDRGGPPDSSGIGVSVGECAEEPLGDVRRIVRSRFGIRLVGVGG